MDLQIIKSKISHCIDRIYNEDGDLFGRKNYEVTVSCKLSQYLFLEFQKYDVDCEYDKHKNIKKKARINGEDKKIRPDILIHKRGNDDSNIVAIEVKKKNNPNRREYDFAKLKSLTSQTGDYKYKLGVFIDFAKLHSNLIIKYFEDGRETQ